MRFGLFPWFGAWYHSVKWTLLFSHSRGLSGDPMHSLPLSQTWDSKSTHSHAPSPIVGNCLQSIRQMKNACRICQATFPLRATPLVLLTIRSKLQLLYCEIHEYLTKSQWLWWPISDPGNPRRHTQFSAEPGRSREASSRQRAASSPPPWP